MFKSDPPKYEFVDGPPPLPSNLPGNETKGWIQKFLPQLAEKRPGEWVRIPDVAVSLPARMKELGKELDLKVEVTTRSRPEHRYIYTNRKGKRSVGFKKTDLYVRVWPNEVTISLDD